MTGTKETTRRTEPAWSRGLLARADTLLVERPVVTLLVLYPLFLGRRQVDCGTDSPLGRDGDGLARCGRGPLLLGRPMPQALETAAACHGTPGPEAIHGLV